ncbi:MAG: hypothetical protein Q7J35_17985 [Candidatus Methanoperedens sp.]|nr:hypothetical protein [Candidatus Methanoperedens sp.]
MPGLFYGSVIKPAVLTLAKLSPGFYPAPNPREGMGFLGSEILIGKTHTLIHTPWSI